MSRTHAFVVAILVGAAAVAGLVALTRSSAVAGTPQTPTSSADQISYRLDQLAAAEASLRKQLAIARSEAAKPQPAGVAGVALVADEWDTDDWDEEKEHDDDHDDSDERHEGDDRDD